MKRKNRIVSISGSICLFSDTCMLFFEAEYNMP